MASLSAGNKKKEKNTLGYTCSAKSHLQTIVPWIVISVLLLEGHLVKGLGNFNITVLYLHLTFLDR